MNIDKACPCGFSEIYQQCCQPYHCEEKTADDPEILMRSRYSAFALSEIDYLKATWHPETLPDDLNDDFDDDTPSTWVGLEIIDWAMDEEEIAGEVEFKAKLIHGSKLEILHEIGQFEKISGKWLYHSGEFKNDGQHMTKISKGEPCPCDSGKKFKNCHFSS